MTLLSPDPRSAAPVDGRYGAVSAAHPLAARAGAVILEQGGNAIDAAVATAAALNVVEPFMSGLGGMGVAVIRIAETGEVHALDFVPPVPVEFPPRDARRRAELLVGARAVGIPGNLAGWDAAARRFGSLSFDELLAPAISLANDGYELSAFAAGEFRAAAETIAAKGEEFLARWMRQYAGPAGEVARPGALIRQPALARTFEAIACDGVGVVYGGRIGQDMVALARQHGSTLTVADLEAYQPVWREPLIQNYRQLRIHVPPPPSEAFQFLLGMKLIEQLPRHRPIADEVTWLHQLMRAIRLAAGERVRWNLPDADRLEQLFDSSNLESLAARLCAEGVLEGPVEHALEPLPDVPEQHTTSFSAVDRDGNAVCVTQSLGSPFGAGLVLDQHGICLTNLLAWGDLHPGGPKRLLPRGLLALPIAPSVSVSSDGSVLAMGTPGSYGIPQTQTQVIVQHIDRGASIQQAISAPRFRLMDGRKVLIERRVPEAVLEGLAALGHDIERAPDWTRLVGGVHAASVDRSGLVFDGGADPRRDGAVVFAQCSDQTSMR
jgi:gamma-glutamyltranspeptidase/glutathione hydrolase